MKKILALLTLVTLISNFLIPQLAEAEEWQHEVHMSYDYEVIEGTKGFYTRGAVNLWMENLPDDIEEVCFFQRNSPPSYPDIDFYHLRTFKYVDENHTVYLERPLVWNSYRFKVVANTPNGTIETRQYRITECIAPEDLELINGNLSVSDLNDTEVCKVDRKTIKNTTSKSLEILLYDLTGKQVFNGSVEPNQTFILPSFNGEIYILNLKSDKNTLTQKIVL